MKPLVVSWFCPNDCDIKMRTTAQIKHETPAGSMWERLKYKVSRNQAFFLESEVKQMESSRQPWHVCLWSDGVTWDVLKSLTLDQTLDAHTIIDIDPMSGTIDLRKSRAGHRSFDELPNQWSP